jgi:hypothetical protein
MANIARHVWQELVPGFVRRDQALDDRQAKVSGGGLRVNFDS